jgi:hypothetical protein
VDISSLNWLAVLAASVSAFIVGGLWYGPLFGRVWQRENGLSDEAIAQSSKLLIYGGALILIVLAAFSLGMFIGNTGGWRFGLFAGVMTGVFFVSTFLGVLYLFERKSLRLFLINAGYCSITFAIMGTIIGAWH